MADTFDLCKLNLLTALYENSPVAVSVIDMSGRFVHGNPALCRLYGYSLRELCSMTIFDLAMVPDENRMRLDQAANGATSGYELEKVFRRCDGSALPVRIRTQIVHDESGAAFSVAHVEDRRDELRRLQDLDRLASTDPITGIANQRGLEQFFARCPGPHHVAVFDLSSSRSTSLSLAGSENGADFALETIRRLAIAAVHVDQRYAPQIARLNHTSFMIGFDHSWRTQDVEHAIDRCRQALTRVFVIGGLPAHVDFAIGVASSTEDTAETTIVNAAAAAQISRQDLNGSVVFLGPEAIPADEHRRRAADLVTAIASGNLRTAIQPIVDIRTHAVIGAEALARWTHPTDGEISPTEFILLAEESNVLYDLTRLVMSDALRFIKTAPAPQTRISVNVTSSLIESPSFADEVLELLDDYSLDASVLCLELTESMIVRALPLAEKQVGILANHGVRWSLDDFGTGYSSLSRLVELPFTEIKIDRRFVAGALDDHRCRAVVEGAVGLGRSMDLDVVAEGVETVDQARLMRELGVHHAQGFLFGRPQLHVRP